VAATVVSGKLVNAKIDDFSTFVVNGDYSVDGAIARQTAAADKSGSYSLELPEKGMWKGPLELLVTAASGRKLGSVGGLSENDQLDNVDIAVAEDVPPAVVETSDDPTLGAIPRFTGRVITSSGEGQRGRLLVVLWGVTPAAASAHAVAVAETVARGYFAGDWPPEVLSRAFARVAGGPPLEVPLDGDRLPRRIVLVVDDVPDVGDDGAAPPRAPTAEDLAAEPDAFATDVGDCATFNVPNRTVEEVTFQAVVRTTQPEIRGTGRRQVPPIQRSLLQRLYEVAGRAPTIDAPRAIGQVEAVGGGEGRELVVRANRIARVTTDVLPADAAPDDRALALIGARGRSIELEGSVLAELAREPGGVTPTRLLTAQKTSLVRDFRNEIATLATAQIARFDLDADHQADWDAVPYANQATTVAHGHILTMKQVWRADGYSLGDLLYSMALAPGQQKLVSLLDWERRETTARTERRTATEVLTADLAHDRDITDIVRSALHEHMDAHSEASTSAFGGALGGFIGPVVFGAAGGVSSASSTANQASARDVAATTLNQARDRTLQSASAVRGQRATVVQTAREGESVQAQTEAIANYNHCHALTIEYFEVLRHFQVSQELAAVQECLFIPFEITPFSDRKAIRWRHVLQDRLAYFGGAVLDLRPKFDSLARVSENWANADLPLGRYADDWVRSVTGEFWVQISIPRPADDANDHYDDSAWAPYDDLLGNPTHDATKRRDVFDRYLGIALPKDRGQIWNTRIGPAIARRLIDHVTVEVSPDNGTTYTGIGLDATLVTPFTQNGQLLMTIRNSGNVTGITRAGITRVRLGIGGVAVPAGVEAIVQSGSMRYRTDFLTGDLFDDYRIQNDLSTSDPVEIVTPLTKFEKSNPRQNDRKEARLLLDILNERVEFFHRVIWLTMDPNRRYMFLDGVIAPDAGGRSVASVVENRIIGIVGNCLVMPVVPGLKLDPTYEFAAETQEDLRNLYAADPPPPMRISVPTRGVFAEAVLGQCNSCEKIDDTRFWHWEEAPIPDSPTAILPLSTASRRKPPPSVTPADFPEALVHFQTVPTAPDPTGLAAALSLLGSKDLFRNLTGLALNQENAAAALKGVMTAAQTFASQGAALAQQRFLSKSLDRNLDLIKKARDAKQVTPEGAQKLTESMFRGALGEKRPESTPVTDSPAVKRAVERVTSSESGEMRITRPGGTVEVKTGNKAAAEGINVSVDPAVDPVKQKSSMTCWAAAGTMMASWKAGASMTPESVLDGLGGSWRAKFDADQGLTTAELRAFADAFGLRQEGPASYTVEGLARLVKQYGPLWVISDDSFDGNKVVHAPIVTAVKGDGSIDGTTVTLVDPIPGAFVTEPFTKFAQRLEAADVVKFGVGIYHW
jgi:Papain-like cysteine protease AvrRpt2